MKTNILLIDYREPSYRSIKLAYPQYNFWWARKPNEADGILVNFFAQQSHNERFFDELWITILDDDLYATIKNYCQKLITFKTPVRIYQGDTSLINKLVTLNYNIYRKDFFKCKTSLAS